MVIKKLFKGKSGGRSQPVEDSGEATLEDLIVLERYGEAEGRLKALLKDDPNNLHHHLKLAEVYTALDRREAAVDEYLFVADEHARDGFYDKGIALLARALKLTPGEERLRLKMYALEKTKGMEHKRSAAVEGLRQSRHPDGGTGTKVLIFQRLWISIAASPLMQRLSPDQIRRLMSAVEIVKLANGDSLASRGSEEPVLYVLGTGTVEARLSRAEGKATLLRTFTSGDLIGESATLERGSWPADYWVVEEGVGLRLDRAGVEYALAGNSDPRGFLEALRMDANDQQIADMVQKLEARSS
jgi:hypothetical protein